MKVNIQVTINKERVTKYSDNQIQIAIEIYIREELTPEVRMDCVFGVCDAVIHQ